MHTLGRPNINQNICCGLVHIKNDNDKNREKIRKRYNNYKMQILLDQSMNINYVKFLIFLECNKESTMQDITIYQQCLRKAGN